MDIAKDHFSSYIRYNKGFEKYRSLIAEKRSKKSQVIVLKGPTNIGKSWWANKNTKNPFYAFHPTWFDGYDGVSDIIMNDYTGAINFNVLLQMLDEYPWTVEFKGGVINWNPRRIVITTNFRWEDWYDYTNINADPLALFRRFDYYYDPATAVPNVWHFTDEWTDIANIPNPYPVPVNATMITPSMMVVTAPAVLDEDTELVVTNDSPGGSTVDEDGEVLAPESDDSDDYPDFYVSGEGWYDGNGNKIDMVESLKGGLNIYQRNFLLNNVGEAQHQLATEDECDHFKDPYWEAEDYESSNCYESEDIVSDEDF